VVLNENESKGIWACIGLISQYIRDPEIAAEFNKYREFYKKYSEDYDSEQILTGAYDTRPSNVSAEGRLAVVSVLVGKLNSEAGMAMSLSYAIDLLTEKPDITINEIKTKLKSNLTPEERKGLQYTLECKIEDADMDVLREELKERTERFETHLMNAMEFAKASFGTGPETISLLTGMMSCYNIVMFSKPGGNLYRYNDELLSVGRNKRIQDMMGEVQ